MKPSLPKYLSWIWLVLLSAGLILVGAQQANSRMKTPSFDEIDVQRINIVEPDGKPRVIISNNAKGPGLIWGGKEYRHSTRPHAGGFLFFNSDGDEVGGLAFDNAKDGTDTSASSGLLFDQYKQDQTVGLVYEEKNGRRAAGLKVWDRPDWPLLPIIEMSDQAARATTEAQRQAIRERMQTYAVAQGPMPGERLFAGKSLDDALVRLADKQGHPRLVLKVDGSGRPSVEFLDANGKVTRRITEIDP